VPISVGRRFTGCNWSLRRQFLDAAADSRGSERPVGAKQLSPSRRLRQREERQQDRIRYALALQNTYPMVTISIGGTLLASNPQGNSEKLFEWEKEQTAVAFAFYQTCRQETIERLKMREQIMFGYVAAVAALVGYAANTAKDPSKEPLIAMLQAIMFQLLLILLPFLSMVSSNAMAQHQEQIQWLSEYFARDLAPFLPACHPQVTIWARSSSLHRSINTVLKTTFVGQIILVCGPWLMLALLYLPYYFHESSMRLKDLLLVPGFLITAQAGRRLYQEWRFRVSSANRIRDAYKISVA
jgi:hypothetical protein